MQARCGVTEFLAFERENNLQAAKEEHIMKYVTLSDIAQKTGYSINTVSHALHDKPDISPKTKALIIEAANQMGYIPNASASFLRSGKSKCVAIIVGDISNPHFSIMIKEMEGRLREQGYTALILNTDENEELEHSAIASAIGRGVDGIIICPVQTSAKNMDFLTKCRLPYVLFGRYFKNFTSNYVVCDDINGGFVAAEHLVRLGHKKLLFVNVPEYISSSFDRLQGIRRALMYPEAQDVRLETEEITLTNNERQVTEILEKHKDCTGIICFSDLIAMQVCHYLKQTGRRVPEDASVIGFDNIVSKFCFPLMLTSVTSSKTRMSIQAVDILMEAINNPEFKSQVVLPTRLVEQESTMRTG